MARPSPARPVKLFVGMLSGKLQHFAQARGMLERSFSPVDVESAVLGFDFTDYYEKEMRPGLKRKFLGFAELIDPSQLLAVKRESATLEAHFRQLEADIPRPLNLDPGYVDLSKVVLSTFKDCAHRIYLGQGVYAEVTLHYHKGVFCDWPWTYADYRSRAYKRFFQEMRQRYLLQLKQWKGPGNISHEGTWDEAQG